MSVDVLEKPVKSITFDQNDLVTFAIERILRTLPQAEMKTEHEFCHGIYARTLYIPKGMILSGEIHKDESFFVVRSGNLAVTTPEGSALVSAGFHSVTVPGQKRLGIAMTDCVVTTYHANPLEIRDPDEILEYYTVPAPQELLDEVDRALLEVSK